MSSVQVINLKFYDISSSLNPQAWSPNAWKARVVLNYKRIPYQTVWVSFPDIEPTVKKLGCSYTRIEGGQPLYTLPVIVDSSGGTDVVVSGSLEIAKYLDAKYPDRPVIRTKGRALEQAFELFLWDHVGRHLRPVMTMPTYRILDERGKVYFRESRERWYGKTLENMCADRAADWATIKQGFDAVAKLLDLNGPDVDFVAGGTEPTRADMILVSFLACIKIIAPEEGWKDILENGNGGRWQRLWDKSEEWRVVH